MFIDTNGRELDEWPFAPGESPFRIKGLNYRGHLEWTEVHYPGGVEAMHGLLPPEHSEFFRQPFLAASKLDLHPLCVAGRQMAATLNRSYLDFVRMRCVWQAGQDVKGVHKWLLKLISAERVAQILPRMIQQNFTFGDARMSVVDKGHVSGVVDKIPAALLPWWAAVIETYVQEILRMGGAPQSHVSVRRQRATGSARGPESASVDVDVFVHAA